MLIFSCSESFKILFVVPVFVVLKTESLCSPGYSGAHHVDQAVSVSWTLRLKGYTTMPIPVLEVLENTV